jgi:hypothetical protein
VFVDAEPWRQITITNPRGREVVDVEAEDVIRNYGLTELFSESSEPPFDEFPFEEFKRLFAEGTYTFTGRTVEGQLLRRTVRFSHTVPDAPRSAHPERARSSVAGAWSWSGRRSPRRSGSTWSPTRSWWSPTSRPWVAPRGCWTSCCRRR